MLTDKQQIKVPESNDTKPHFKPTPRPKRLYGYTEKVATGQGKMLVTINEDQDGNLFEVIARLGKSGGDEAAMSEALSRIISIALRAGVDPMEIIDQLKGQGGSQPVVHQFEGAEKGTFILSVPDGLGKALEYYLMSKSDDDDPKIKEINEIEIRRAGRRCPDCGSPDGYIPENGCFRCLDCGYSKCA